MSTFYVDTWDSISDPPACIATLLPWFSSLKCRLYPENDDQTWFGNIYHSNIFQDKEKYKTMKHLNKHVFFLLTSISLSDYDFLWALDIQGLAL